jgi:ribose 5-phosphate isomerase A
MSNSDEEKRLAAAAAVKWVKDGMVVGLGTGSTATHAITMLGKLCREGLSITGIPTSSRSAALAWEVGIPLIELERVGQIDVTIDGADEFDPKLNLLKGGGGALLREKIVASCSKKVVIVTDSSKQVPVLGHFPLPVEVLPFAAQAVAQRLRDEYGIEVVLRQGADGLYSTDQANWIADCHFGAIPDPAKLGAALSSIPGVLGHGLFVGMASVLLVAHDGGVQELHSGQ